MGNLRERIRLAIIRCEHLWKPERVDAPEIVDLFLLRQMMVQQSGDAELGMVCLQHIHGEFMRLATSKTGLRSMRSSLESVELEPRKVDPEDPVGLAAGGAAKLPDEMLVDKVLADD